MDNLLEEKTGLLPDIVDLAISYVVPGFLEINDHVGKPCLAILRTLDASDHSFFFPKNFQIIYEGKLSFMKNTVLGSIVSSSSDEYDPTKHYLVQEVGIHYRLSYIGWNSIFDEFMSVEPTQLKDRKVIIHRSLERFFFNHQDYFTDFSGRESIFSSSCKGPDDPQSVFHSVCLFQWLLHKHEVSKGDSQAMIRMLGDTSWQLSATATEPRQEFRFSFPSSFLQVFKQHFSSWICVRKIQDSDTETLLSFFHFHDPMDLCSCIEVRKPLAPVS